MYKLCRKCNQEKAISEFHRRLDAYAAACKLCANAYGKEWRKKHPDRRLRSDRNKVIRNPEKYREAQRRKRLRDPERYRAHGRNFKARHKEKIKEYSRIYRLANREAQDKATRAWQKRNRDRINKAKAKRRAIEINAMPTWADKEKIAEFYAEAERLTRETGIGHHVDHIVPLNSPIVCGLHCEFNLQILTGSENISKSNRRWPDMPDEDVWEWVKSEEFRSSWKLHCSDLPNRKRPPIGWDAIPKDVRSRMATERNLAAWAKRSPEERKRVGENIAAALRKKRLKAEQ